LCIKATDREESASSLSEVSSLDDDFDRMHFGSASSGEEVTPDSQKIIQSMLSMSIGISSWTKLLALWFVKLIDTRSNTCKPMRLEDGQTFFKGNQPLMKRCSNFWELLSG